MQKEITGIKVRFLGFPVHKKRRAYAIPVVMPKQLQDSYQCSTSMRAG
jgi:hypothetical protein